MPLTVDHLVRETRPDILQLKSHRAQNDPGGYLGPWLMALVGISFMLGTLASQSAKYFSAFGYEGSLPWQSPALQLVSRLTAFVSQLFFVHRCYLLYNRSKLVYASLMLVPPALSINLVTDIAITGLTLWKLGRRGGQTYSPATESVLRRLRNATVEAALPPAVCAVLNLIAYLVLSNLTHHWFVMMTTRFYVWSLMFTLNSRATFRRQLQPPKHGDDQTLSTGFQFANLEGPGPKSQDDHLPELSCCYETNVGLGCTKWKFAVTFTAKPGSTSRELPKNPISRRSNHGTNRVAYQASGERKPAAFDSPTHAYSDPLLLHFTGFDTLYPMPSVAYAKLTLWGFL
ncbi:hypothetical protein M407DRAFT_4050 [Tulasnella calospora MUT 4182]|uniref:DUF6534 domain-containing protein n=1 Tax=Tulasnella calospora MUT 4182 TaxID=1051891 RepID=A0A0C3QWL1_9AGAM|nr:hypothetical protein M407DRAFT_4050 [Tulasnella calospora MUT 4182]